MRIDDLAHESGLTVDTIRYYQREGLLPPGEREGRHRSTAPSTSAPRAHQGAPGPALLARRDPRLRVGRRRRPRGRVRRRGRRPPATARRARRAQRHRPPSSPRRCAKRGSCATRTSTGASRTTATTSTCSGRWPSCDQPRPPGQGARRARPDLRRGHRGDPAPDRRPLRGRAPHRLGTATSSPSSRSGASTRARRMLAVDAAPRRLHAPPHDPAPHPRPRRPRRRRHRRRSHQRAPDRELRPTAGVARPWDAPSRSVVEVPDAGGVAARDLLALLGGMWPIVSSITLREYGQSLPWCG